MGKIKKIDNFFDDELFDEVFKYCQNASWQYGTSTLGIIKPEYDRKFWIKYLDDNELFTKRVFNHILKRFGNKYTLDRVYMNGQTYGQNGGWHTDFLDDNKNQFCTVLIYMSEITFDNVNHVGGYTYFRMDNDVIMALEPIINRAVMFDGDVLHKGNAPLDHNMLRCSIAFKLKKMD